MQYLLHTLCPLLAFLVIVNALFKGFLNFYLWCIQWRDAPRIAFYLFKYRLVLSYFTFYSFTTVFIYCAINSNRSNIFLFVFLCVRNVLTIRSVLYVATTIPFSSGWEKYVFNYYFNYLFFPSLSLHFPFSTKAVKMFQHDFLFLNFCWNLIMGRNTVSNEKNMDAFIVPSIVVYVTNRPKRLILLNFYVIYLTHLLYTLFLLINFLLFLKSQNV